MNLLDLVLTIAVMGLIVWAITNLIPMPEVFKRAIYIICVLFLAFYILNAFGIHVPDIRLGRF